RDDLGISRSQIGGLSDHFPKIERCSELDVGIAKLAGNNLGELNLFILIGRIEKDRASPEDEGGDKPLTPSEHDDLGAPGSGDVDQGWAFGVNDVECERIIEGCP